MSEWHDIKPKQLELSDDRKTIQINTAYNDFGNIWIEIKVSDIMKFLKKNKFIV